MNLYKFFFPQHCVREVMWPSSPNFWIPLARAVGSKFWVPAHQEAIARSAYLFTMLLIFLLDLCMEKFWADLSIVHCSSTHCTQISGKM